MASMSPRWISEKFWAEAGSGAPPRAIANRAGARKRNEGIGKSFCGEFPGNSCERRRWEYLSGSIVVQLGLILVVFLAGKQPGAHNVVSLDPSRRPDREPRLGPGGEIARGFVVAAEVGGLGRCQIGLRVVSLSAIGHGELGVADRCLGFARHRGAQNRDCLLGVGLIVGRHERLPK